MNINKILTNCLCDQFSVPLSGKLVAIRPLNTYIIVREGYPYNLSLVYIKYDTCKKGFILQCLFQLR